MHLGALALEVFQHRVLGRSVHHGVVGLIPLEVLTMELLDVLHSKDHIELGRRLASDLLLVAGDVVAVEGELDCWEELLDL